MFTVPVIISIIQAVIAGAPDIEKAVVAMQQLIASLFTSKVISVADQATLMDVVDQACDDVSNGRVPTWWTVEADPK